MEENKIEIKCDYCGRSEICKGSYPEGCFLENKLMKEWDKKYNDFKTPKDMSDKSTIKFEKTKTIIAKEMGYHDWEKCINDQPNYMVEQVMDKVVESYAEKRLEDVLVEYQDYIDFNEEHDRNASKSERIKSFLNHLKQRKG